MSDVCLRPAALAFDAVAPLFDARFGGWLSVAAQRRAVRRALVTALPVGGRVLEVGGGTGEDAVWLARRGFRVTLTDASPAMATVADAKLKPFGLHAEVAAAEELNSFADRHLQAGGELFDGVFSNFAPLNCVENLTPVAQALARLVRPGGSATLVLFGIASPGEILVESLSGHSRQALRRFRRGAVPARLGGKNFTVTYHRAAALRQAMQPWFQLARKQGIGIFVPPSAAEPWISRHPYLLAMLEGLDRYAARPLASLGDHILYHFTRQGAPAP
jgi:ubiquinone/menaquinone biosynthesis C-methylase UbiE